MDLEFDLHDHYYASCYYGISVSFFGLPVDFPFLGLPLCRGGGRGARGVRISTTYVMPCSSL